MTRGGVQQKQNRKQVKGGVSRSGSLKFGRDPLRRGGEKQGLAAQTELLSKSRLTAKDREAIREVVARDRREYETCECIKTRLILDIDFGIANVSTQRALEAYQDGRLLGPYSDDEGFNHGDGNGEDWMAVDQIEEEQNREYNHILEDILGVHVSNGM